MDFSLYVLWDRFPGFNSTARLFQAVQKALRQEFVVDQGQGFNVALAEQAQ